MPTYALAHTKIFRLIFEQRFPWNGAHFDTNLYGFERLDQFPEKSENSRNSKKL